MTRTTGTAKDSLLVRNVLTEVKRLIATSKIHEYDGNVPSEDTIFNAQSILETAHSALLDAGVPHVTLFDDDIHVHWKRDFKQVTLHVHSDAPSQVYHRDEHWGFSVSSSAEPAENLAARLEWLTAGPN